RETFRVHVAYHRQFYVAVKVNLVGDYRARLCRLSLDGFSESEVGGDDTVTPVGIDVVVKVVVLWDVGIVLRLSRSLGKLDAFGNPEHDVLLVGRACIQQEGCSHQKPPVRMTSFLQIGYDLTVVKIQTFSGTLQKTGAPGLWLKLPDYLSATEC